MKKFSIVVRSNEVEVTDLRTITATFPKGYRMLKQVNFDAPKHTFHCEALTAYDALKKFTASVQKRNEIEERIEKARVLGYFETRSRTGRLHVYENKRLYG